MDSQQLINIAFALCAALFGLVCTGVTWWVNTIWSDVKSQKKQIDDLQLKLVEGYVPRSEMEKTLNRLFDKMDEISREITHISRNQASVKSLREMLGEAKK